MPPVASPLMTAPLSDHRSQLTSIRFRRAIALMLMTLVLPGSAQLVAGNKKVARIALRTWFALLLCVVLLALIGLVSHTFVFWFVTNGAVLGFLQLLLESLAGGPHAAEAAALLSKLPPP